MTRIVTAVMAFTVLSGCQAIELLHNIDIIKTGFEQIEKSKSTQARLREEIAESCNRLNMYNVGGKSDLDCFPEASGSAKP